MTNKLELRRREVTAHRISNGYTSPRREKRYFAKFATDPKHTAYLEGDCLGMMGKPYSNPYPAGVRHDEFKRGYDMADPMGLSMGTNY